MRIKAAIVADDQATTTVNTLSTLAVIMKLSLLVRNIESVKMYTHMLLKIAKAKSEKNLTYSHTHPKCTRAYDEYDEIIRLICKQIINKLHSNTSIVIWSIALCCATTYTYTYIYNINKMFSSKE